jgi:hypothetical protein
MELIEYILEPAIPFGLVVYILWAFFRREIKDALKDDEGN